MKKILLFVLLLSSLQSFGSDTTVVRTGIDFQFYWGYKSAPPVIYYTNISSRYKWLAGIFDSTLTVPNGTTASIRVRGNRAQGAVFYDSTGVDSGFYVYGSGGVFQRLARAGDLSTTTWQQTLIASSALDQINEVDQTGNSLTFKKGGGGGFNVFEDSDSTNGKGFMISADGISLIRSPIYWTNHIAATDTGAFKPLTINPSTNEIKRLTFWPGGGGATEISALTAAAGTNTINNGDFEQVWQWNTLSGNSGLNLTSNSTAWGSGDALLRIELEGANASSTVTSYGLEISNVKTGTASTNIGASFTATGGSTNYAARFTRGKTSFGTAGTESGIFEINGGTSGTVTIQPAAAAGTYTLTLPTNDGDDKQVLQTNGSGVTSWATIPAEIGLAISDEVTDLTTGTAKITFRMPYAMTVTAVRFNINTVSSSGLPTVDINEAGTTILSTKLSIDASEKTSTTAATPPVISDAVLADDAEITIDIDVAGTGAKGGKVWIIGRRN